MGQLLGNLAMNLLLVDNLIFVSSRTFQYESMPCPLTKLSSVSGSMAYLNLTAQDVQDVLDPR